MTHKLKLASTTALAMGLGLTCLPAMAQEAVADDGFYLGRIVVVGYDADGNPVYAGDNTSHLEGTAITAQGGTARIDDVLRQTPGVGSRLDIGQPGVAVAVRGLQGQGRVAMTVEGVPQNFRFNGHASEGYAYVEQAFLAGIDVTRGAAVSEGGLAGAVNFRLLNAEDLVDGEGSGGLIRLSYGNNGDNFSGMVTTATIAGPYSIVGGFATNEADPYEDGDDVTVANTGRDTQSVFLRAGYEIDGTQSIELLASRIEADFAANSYYQELYSDLFKLSYDLNASDAVDLSVDLYRSSTNSEYVGSVTGTGSYVGRVMEVTTTGLDVTNTSRFSFGNWDLTSTNGLTYVKDELGGEAGGANPTFGDATRFSAFSENIFTNGPWEITAGLRFSDYSLRGELNNIIESGPVNIDADSLDPKLTVAYQVNDWFQPYLSAYSTTRMPSLQETLQESYHGYGFFNLYLGPNPDLVPETSTGAEIGANIDRSDVFATGDRLTARLAYFQMDIENYVAYVEEDTFVPGVGALTNAYYDNIPGTTESRGFELEATYETDALSVALSYTNSDSVAPAGSEGMALQPPSTLSATVAGHFLDRALTTGVTYSHTSGGTALDGETAIDSYDLWDLFASYEVSDNFVIIGKVSNVLDETYTPWAANGHAPGQNVFVGAEIRF